MTVSARTDHSPVALLVDRDRDTRQMYAEFLKRSAFDIDEAEDGREALAKAISRVPDVIVTETRLAGINGFDLCHLLRSDSATCEIPIVVVTGDAFEVDVQRAAAMGADTVLTKPCLPDCLTDEIRRLLAISHELRAKGREVREVRAAVAVQLGRSRELLDRSRQVVAKRQMLSRTFDRRDTTEPPLHPPELRCPACDGALHYEHSHIGGVSIKHQEQWDYFECPACHGSFQFRQRTRRLRRIA